MAQGDYTGGLASFHGAQTILDKFAKADPGNTDWQDALANLCNFIGDAQIAHGDTADALKSYSDGLVISTGWGSAPANTDRQFDLSVALFKVGYAHLKQGDAAAAFKFYRDGLAIRQHLVSLDASNTQWKNALKNVIDYFGALAYESILARDFSTALAAADQAISLTPDQIWLYTNRAHALMFVGRTEEARALYLRVRGQKMSDGKPWVAAILGDFAEFRKAGLTSPLMDEINTLFTSAG